MAKKKRKKTTRSSSKKKSSRRTSLKRKKGARRAAKKAKRSAKKRKQARGRKTSAKRRKPPAKKKRGKAKARRSSAKKNRRPAKAKRPSKNPKGAKPKAKRKPAKKAKRPARAKRSTTITCRVTRNPGPMLGVLTCCNPERHLPGCRCVAPQPLAPRKLPKRALAPRKNDRNALCGVCRSAKATRGDPFGGLDVCRPCGAGLDEQMRGLDGRRFSNPSRGKKRGKKRASGSALDRFLATQKVGAKIKWKNLPESVRRDPLAKKAALMKLRRLRTQGYKLELDDVLLIVRPRAPGMSAACVHVGDEIASEYRDEGGRHYRHAAGDHGRGKKKTKPAAIAIDAKTGQQHLLGGHGVRRGFSSRGLVG